MLTYAFMTAAVLTMSTNQAAISLQSNPDAQHTFYLDFDGHTLPPDKSGKSVQALSAGYGTAEIISVWEVTAESLRPFQINVTTDEAVFMRAPANKRIRAVVMPNYKEYGSGSGTGERYSYGNDKSVIAVSSIRGDARWTGVALAHELAHTTGLDHDGVAPDEHYKGQRQAYYNGHGNWGTIMGRFDSAVNQWSHGDYPGADNLQDDIAELGAVFGFRHDDHPDDHYNNQDLFIHTKTEGHIYQQGLINNRQDEDWFSFSTKGGQINIEALPHAVLVMLDIGMELYDIRGNKLAESRPANDAKATLKIKLPEGQYSLRLFGDANPGVYSDYGSIGSYLLTGQVERIRPAKVLPNQLPQIQWNNPQPSLKLNGKEVPTLKFKISDADQETVSVQFSVNGHQVNTFKDGDIYALKWPGQLIGENRLNIIATDAKGSRSYWQHELSVISDCTVVIPPADMSIVDFSNQVDETKPMFLPAKASFALDHRRDTYWLSGFDTSTSPSSEYITLALKEEALVHSIELVPSTALPAFDPVLYQWHASHDKQHWERLTPQETVQHLRYQKQWFAPKKAKYLRITINKVESKDVGTVSIGDIRIERKTCPKTELDDNSWLTEKLNLLQPEHHPDSENELR